MHRGKAKWTETSKPGSVPFLSNFIFVIIIIYLLIILFKDPRKRHQLVSDCNQKSVTRELLTLCRIVRLTHLIGSWWRVVLRTEQHSMIMRAM